MNIIYADLAATALDFSRSKYDPYQIFATEPFREDGEGRISRHQISQS